MDSQIKRIAVLTSGGDAPGMNAAIRAVVRTAKYHNLHVYGIKNGYDGMIDGEISRLETNMVGNILHRGGTILKTSRSDRFRTKEGRQMAFESLQAHDIDGLIVIGGNGTFTGAHYFSQEHNIPVVGVPGTIDNDLYGTDYTIGYDTAINTAVEAIDKIRDTADSHNRVFCIEVMGRDAGFIALDAAIAGGASAALIPETVTEIDTLVDILKKGHKRKKLFSLIIVAEGNQNGNAAQISTALSEKLPELTIRSMALGYIQRGGSPSTFERVLASRLGYGAVEGLLEGKASVMCGLENNNIVYVSFDDAINKKKEPKPQLIEMARILSL